MKTAGGDIHVTVSSLMDFTLNATVQIRGNWAREIAKDSVGIFHGTGKVKAVANESAGELKATLGTGPLVVELSTVNGKIVIEE